MNPNPDHSDTLLHYTIRRLKNTSLFEVVSKAVKYIRRSFLVSRILRYTAAVVLFVETSAILLAVLTAFLITVPAIAVVLLAQFLYAREKSKAFAFARMKKEAPLVLHLTDGEAENADRFEDGEQKKHTNCLTNGERAEPFLLLNPSLLCLFQPPKKREGHTEVSAVFLFVIKRNRYPYQILKKETNSDNNNNKT